jgi:heme oxygenase
LCFVVSIRVLIGIMPRVEKRGNILPAKFDVLGPCVPSLVLESLAIRLKRETETLHRETESALDIFGSAKNLAQYTELLRRFYRLYRPLESVLAGFDQSGQYGITITERAHSGRLASDLQFLGIDPLELEDSPDAYLPVLQNFPHALGAMYVLEGSTLGSIYVLRHFKQLLADQIVGADSFFSGYGERTVAFWNRFKTSLDTYGVERPCDIPQVIQGAKSTFVAIGNWMKS